MESMEHHHGYKIENHGNQSKVFFSQQYIYTVFLPLATNKMVLNKTLLNICNFLNKYIIVQVACSRGMKYR